MGDCIWNAKVAGSTPVLTSLLLLPCGEGLPLFLLLEDCHYDFHSLARGNYTAGMHGFFFGHAKHHQRECGEKQGRQHFNENILPATNQPL